MRLNHDFYTFSPKHYRELAFILSEYPEIYKSWMDYLIYTILPCLPLLGKVSLKSVKDSEGEVVYFIKFWPHPKYQEKFRQFDKKKLIDNRFHL